MKAVMGMEMTMAMASPTVTGGDDDGGIPDQQ